ncbi:hypothetical protein LH22_19630 [Pantoea rwandensis]|uniref:Uncharacterized protein n=1 Tax=Pantoea rwandensis TaxID=1076550 RepID=A0ABM5RP15_9GAMM|nr:hypothetical protein LH22_19630 [Pantoea rwandensis]
MPAIIMVCTMGISAAVGMTNKQPAIAISITQNSVLPTAPSACGNSQTRAAPSNNTAKIYSGMVFQNSRHMTRSQRVRNGCSLSAAITMGAAMVCSGTLRCTSDAIPSTMIKPATSRIAAKCQPSTKPIKISVAGFSSGFASQKAIAAPLDTCD